MNQKDNTGEIQREDTYQNLDSESWKYPERRIKVPNELDRIKHEEQKDNEFKFQFDNEVPVTNTQVSIIMTY